MLPITGGHEISSSLSHFPDLKSNSPLLSPLRFPSPTYSTNHFHHCRTTLSIHDSLQTHPHFSQTLKSRRLPSHHRFSFHLSLVRASPVDNFVEQLTDTPPQPKEDESDYSPDGERDFFDFEERFESTELRKLPFNSPVLDVKELAELPENWRRSKLAWLCKELPSHKRPTMTRLLNAQKKWVRQEDATYVAVHCMRIRENEAGFWVYKWMIQQHWFKFDFALATKLADYLGRERKYAKCREVFNDIINQGRVPSESTFHILIVAYLSVNGEDCLEEACAIYNRMIQLGGYRPRLNLHNSLFKAIVSKPWNLAKKYLKQAEFIFHNVSTSGFEIHKDIFGGLIWLHSFQEIVDRERVLALRKEMELAGIEQSRDVLLSILRAFSKVRDVDEAEATWNKLLSHEGSIPSQAFVYKMEVYSKAGDPMKSLEIFKQMKDELGSVNLMAYHKIIEVLSRARELELVEPLMEELIRSKLKPLAPSYINLMSMYFQMGLYDKVGSAFTECLELCSPNRAIYSIYMDSLVQTGDIEKAGDVFNQMLENATIGVNSRSCNTILRGYLSSEGNTKKAGRIYKYMCQKKYEVEPSLLDQVETVLISSNRLDDKLISVKLGQVQREMLVGLLLGGLRIESDDEGRGHYVRFVFKDNAPAHSIMKRHLYEQFREWLHPSILPIDDSDDAEYDLPGQFFTIPHAYFRFYADQFWPGGKLVIPKLIHRWLSPRVLAYWYMYSGYRTSSGDVLLKLKGNRDDVEKIAAALSSKSLKLKAKQKGKVFWLGFLGENSTRFWELIEPYVVLGLKDLLKADEQSMEHENSKSIRSESDCDDSQDEQGSEVSDNDEI